MRLFYKVTLWSALIGSLFAVIFGLLGEDKITVYVTPLKTQGSFEKPIAIYPNSTVYSSGKLEVKDPSIAQRIVLPGEIKMFGIINNLFVLFLAIVLLVLLKNLRYENVFQNRLHLSLKLIGWLIVAYNLVDIFRSWYASQEIFNLTNNQFRLIDDSRPPSYELWIGVLVIWFANAFKKGMQIQQEQNLTI